MREEGKENLGKIEQHLICLQALENAAILSVKVCWKDRTRKVPIGKLICADLLKTIAAVLLKAGLAKVPSKAPSFMTMVFTLRTMFDIMVILLLFIIVATVWLKRGAAVLCIYLSLHHWQLPGRFFLDYRSRALRICFIQNNRKYCPFPFPWLSIVRLQKIICIEWTQAAVSGHFHQYTFPLPSPMGITNTL